MLTRFSIAIAVVLIAACGGDDDRYQDQGDIVLALAEAVCARGEACGDPIADIEDCAETLRSSTCAGRGTDCEDVVPADVSDAEIDACVADLRARPCDDESTELPASCEAIEGDEPMPLRAALARS